MELTEAEIMRALECAVLYQTTDVRTYNGMPIEEFSKSVLDLINSKNAEKEALIAGQETLQKYIAKCRAEAIKEFAERVKAKHRRITDYDEAGFGCQIFIVEEETIDQIAKEMGVEL